MQPDTICILLKAGFSKALLTNIYSKSGYWAKMGNQRHVYYDTDEKLKLFGKKTFRPVMPSLINYSRNLLPIPMRMGYWCKLHSLRAHTQPEFVLLYKLSRLRNETVEGHCRKQSHSCSSRLSSRNISCRRLLEAMAARDWQPPVYTPKICTCLPPIDRLITYTF